MIPAAVHDLVTDPIGNRECSVSRLCLPFDRSSSPENAVKSPVDWDRTGMQVSVVWVGELGSG